MASSGAEKADGDLHNGGPQPKTFKVARGQGCNIAAAAWPMIARCGSGGFAAGYKAGLRDDDGAYRVTTLRGRAVNETSQVASFKRPTKPLELYEFMACPYCRKVREAISILDLDVTVYPCPKRGPTWRAKVVELGGKAQFPFLVDHNTGRQLYESDAIVKYLFHEYGGGKVPLLLRLGCLTTFTCTLALAPRGTKGCFYKPSRLPDKPLTLWAFELSPFSVLVKEVLCELEIPYVQVTVSRGSPKRQQLLDKRGTFQVPYLEDPNMGVFMFESAAIMDYLRSTYACEE